MRVGLGVLVGCGVAVGVTVGGSSVDVGVPVGVGFEVCVAIAVLCDTCVGAAVERGVVPSAVQPVIQSNTIGKDKSSLSVLFIYFIRCGSRVVELQVLVVDGDAVVAVEASCLVGAPGGGMHIVQVDFYGGDANPALPQVF